MGRFVPPTRQSLPSALGSGRRKKSPVRQRGKLRFHAAGGLWVGSRRRTGQTSFCQGAHRRTDGVASKDQTAADRETKTGDGFCPLPAALPSPGHVSRSSDRPHARMTVPLTSTGAIPSVGRAHPSQASQACSVPAETGCLVPLRRLPASSLSGSASRHDSKKKRPFLVAEGTAACSGPTLNPFGGPADPNAWVPWLCAPRSPGVCPFRGLYLSLSVLKPPTISLPK